MNHQISNDYFDQLKRVGTPVLRPSKFAELTGIAPATVTTLMDRGDLPIVTLTPPMPGRRPTRYINMIALLQHCEKEAASWVN